MSTLLPRLPIALTLCLAAGCSSGNTTDDVVNPADTQPTGDSPTPTDAPGSDVQGVDAAGTDVQPGGDVVAVDVPSSSDGSTPGCGTARPDVSTITGTEGLVIAGDGTIYYSQRAAIGRLPPGGTAQNAWVMLPTGASTVWGLALDVPRHRLYAGSPSTGRIYVVDLTAATPTATALSFAAGGPNGLTMGPDGQLYYTDFNGGHVYMVDAAGTRTQVTSTTIAGANGVAFAADGSLYVDGYATGSLFRLTLTSGHESARTTVATGLGSPDGLAFDAAGKIYVTDNTGRLIRLDADGTNPTVLLRTGSGSANVEFGAGVLQCTDIYVATATSMRRYEMGTTPGAAVPWHM
jgi:sugar lactone lactonase YvrE